MESRHPGKRRLPLRVSTESRCGAQPMLADAVGGILVSTLPAPSAKDPEEASMYRKIIIGYDGTDSADDALALGREVGPRGIEDSPADGRDVVAAEQSA